MGVGGVFSGFLGAAVLLLLLRTDDDAKDGKLETSVGLMRGGKW